MAHPNRHFHPLRPTSAAGRALEMISHDVTAFTGSSWAFAVAAAIILIWLASGPFFHFSDTWQLVVNTGTTVITFLMVFLIQRSQNRDSQALHIKLNEILASAAGASNRLIDVEDLSEKELQTIQRHFRKLSEMTKREIDTTRSHSVEEAEVRHRSKIKGRRRSAA